MGIYSSVKPMNQKPVFLTITLTALLATSGAFWLMQKRHAVTNQPVTIDPVVESPVQTEPQTPIDTSDWKIYRNEEYGFEFRYPEKQFYIKQDSDSAGVVYVTILKNGRTGIDIDKPGKIGILLNNLPTEKYLFSKSNGVCNNIQLNSQMVEMCDDSKAELESAMRSYDSFSKTGACTSDFGFSFPLRRLDGSKVQDGRHHHAYVLCDSGDQESMSILAEILRSIRFVKLDSGEASN